MDQIKIHTQPPSHGIGVKVEDSENHEGSCLEVTG